MAFEEKIVIYQLMLIDVISLDSTTTLNRANYEPFSVAKDSD